MQLVQGDLQSYCAHIVKQIKHPHSPCLHRSVHSPLVKRIILVVNLSIKVIYEKKKNTYPISEKIYCSNNCASKVFLKP